jgi:excisionase family DNA binding protein
MSAIAASTPSQAGRNQDEVLNVATGVTEVADLYPAACNRETGTAFDDLGLLTLATVAKLLHCSKAHVSNVIAGRIHDCPPIPAVRLGRRRLVRREALAAWIERNEAANDNLKPSPERDRKNA